jgi:hypothetical protein
VLLLDIAVILVFSGRAWQLEARANRWLRRPDIGMPFSSLSKPEHFAPGGEQARRRANAFVTRGFVLVCVYFLARSIM